MTSFVIALQYWHHWVDSTDYQGNLDEGVTWKQGWTVNFWYFLNLSWYRMNDTPLSRLRHSESCWDPDFNPN